MNRRDAIRGGFLSLFAGTVNPAKDAPLPEIRIATDLDKGRTWYVFKHWCEHDKCFYYDLQEHPDEPLGLVEKIDGMVPERELLALQAHGYNLRMINPDATKEG